MIKVTKTIATIAFLFLGCLVNAQVGTLSVSRTEEKGVSFPLFAFGDEVVALAQVGRHLAAAGIVAARLCLGLGAVVAGRALALFALR